MNISQQGIDLIKSFEGLSLKAYKPVPTEKYYTIGYGHYSPTVKAGQVITKHEAENILKNDLKRFVDGVNKLVKVKLNQNQFDALVSFSYNCGLGALSLSTLLELVNKKDFKRASLEFAKWNKGGGKVLAGLVRRREKERQLFLKPSTPQPVKPVAKPPIKHETYTVKAGDNLTKIAKMKGTTVEQLVKLNKIKKPNLIITGQVLVIR